MLTRNFKQSFAWITQYSEVSDSHCSRIDGHRAEVAILGGRGYHSNYGGVENAVREIANQLAARHSLDVVIYGTDPSEVESSTLRNTQLSFVYPPKPIYRRLGQHAAILFCVMHMLFISRPKTSLVFASGPNVFVPLLRLFGIPVVSSLRAVDSARDKWGFISRKILQLGEFFAWRFSSSFTANSVEMVREFSTRRQDVVFIPNGSVSAGKGCTQVIDRLGLKPNQYLLFAARLDPVKRLDVLLESHSQIEPSKRLPLVIAGGHSKSKTYQQHLESYSGPDVIFVGHLCAEELLPLMFHCRAFLLPSVLEGMSNSLLSAMATGRAVLASDIPPNADVLQNNNAVFRVDDIDDLRQSLLRLCIDAQFAAELGASLQRHALKTYTWERTADLFNEILKPYLSDHQNKEVK